MLSVSEFACATGVSQTTVYRKVKTGQIPSSDIAGQTRIPVWYLEKLLAKPGELPGWLLAGEDNV